MVEPLADLLITIRGLVDACLASKAAVSADMIPAFDDAVQACPLPQQLSQSDRAANDQALQLSLLQKLTLQRHDTTGNEGNAG